MKELWKRIKADTPAYFKRVMWAGISLGALCTATLAGLAQAGVEAPPIIDKFLQIGIAVGIVAAMIAKTAKENPPPKD